MKYKIGDKVKIVSITECKTHKQAFCTLWAIGKIGTVYHIQTFGNDWFDYTVAFEGRKDKLGFNEWDLEPINSQLLFSWVE